MRILKLLAFVISVIVLMQSCASNKGYFLPTAKFQSHHLPAKLKQDSLVITSIEKLDFSKNIEPIFTASNSNDFVSDSKLDNYETESLELSKKIEKVDKQKTTVKSFPKTPKLNFIQKTVLKKMEKKGKDKEGFDWNIYLFWLYAGAISLWGIFSITLFYSLSIGLLWSILGGFFILIGFLILYLLIADGRRLLR